MAFTGRLINLWNRILNTIKVPWNHFFFSLRIKWVFEATTILGGNMYLRLFIPCARMIYNLSLFLERRDYLSSESMPARGTNVGILHVS